MRNIMILMNKNIIAKIIFIFISVSALTYAIVMIATFPRWVIDDAFILFRYAENFANGGEINWNLGENPTEGYTGIALLTLIAIAMKVGISPILATHIIGIFFFFCGGIFLLLILRGFNIGSVVALSLYFTAPFMPIHAWSGLETTMFTTLVLFSIYAFTSKRQGLFIFSILSLSFTRPEGVLLSIILLSLFRPITLNLLLLYILPCSLYFIWRWAYYGQLLPNTFYAKYIATGFVSENVSSLRELSQVYLIKPALLGLICITWSSVKMNKRIIIGVAIFSAIAIVNYLSCELVMNYSYRFFIPFYVLVVLTVGGILARTKVDLKVVLLVALLIVPQVTQGRKRIGKIKEYAKTHYNMLQEEHIEAGKFLRDNIPPEEWIIVHSDAGSIPYYSKLKTVDFGRLNNEYLARNYPYLETKQHFSKVRISSKEKKKESDVQDEIKVEYHFEEIVDYFYSFNAGAIVFTSYDFDRVSHGPEARHIIEDNRFTHYALVKKFRSNARRGYFQFVYVHNDLAESIKIDEEALNGRNLISEVTISKDIRQGDRTSNHVSQMEPTSLGDKQKPHELAEETFDIESKSPEEIWEIAHTGKVPWQRIEYYKKLLILYPDHQYVPQALFMIGFVYAEELKELDEARKAFEELIEKYPESEITESAKWMLENLDKPYPKFD